MARHGATENTTPPRERILKMRLRTTLLTGTIATALLLGSAVAALAAPSMASDTSVYDAPHGAEIDTIDRGDDVAIGKCQAGYCYVHDLDDSDTDSGWVRSAAIDFVGGNDDDEADASPFQDNGSLVNLDDIGHGHMGHGKHK